MYKIQKYLFSQVDEKYRAFTLPLIPNVDENSVLGVRLPIIKRYAKQISEEEKKEFLSSLPHQYHEENILHASIISNIKDYDEFLRYIDEFLPFVNNWAVCDSICNKHLNKHKQELINEVRKWLKSKEIYRVRYAVKCLMNYYLDDDFKEEHLTWVSQIGIDDYYVQMMIAWYLATGLAKNYDSFVKVIEEKKFDTFVHNKAIQKSIESYRVSDKHKQYLRTLKV